MSNLVKKFSDKYKSWLKRILDKYQYKLIGIKIWTAENFVTPSTEGYDLAEQFL